MGNTLEFRYRSYIMAFCEPVAGFSAARPDESPCHRGVLVDVIFLKHPLMMRLSPSILYNRVLPTLNA